jgi:hypothetical protein
MGPPYPRDGGVLLADDYSTGRLPLAAASPSTPLKLPTGEAMPDERQRTVHSHSPITASKATPANSRAGRHSQRTHLGYVRTPLSIASHHVL